jgi:hypothetical protein
MLLTTHVGAQTNQDVWRYKPGDEPSYADPKFDDSKWEVISNTSFSNGILPASGWTGVGWFRTTSTGDPAFAGVPAILRFRQPGASEMYIDGILLRRFGSVGGPTSQEVLPSRFELQTGIPFVGPTDGRPHVIAIRYSYMAAADITKGPGRDLAMGENGIGFRMEVAPFGRAGLSPGQSVGMVSGRGGYLESFMQAGLIVVALALALLHFVLYRESESSVRDANLDVILFAFGLGVAVAADYALTRGVERYPVLVGFKWASDTFIVVALTSYLHFFDSIFSRDFRSKMPWMVVVLWAFFVVTVLLVPAYLTMAEFWVATALIAGMFFRLYSIVSTARVTNPSDLRRVGPGAIAVAALSVLWLLKLLQPSQEWILTVLVVACAFVALGNTTWYFVHQLFRKLELANSDRNHLNSAFVDAPGKLRQDT